MLFLNFRKLLLVMFRKRKTLIFYLILFTILLFTVAITFLADVMGPTLKNLNNLLSLPFGCGEQNLANFAPNVYVLKYLTGTRQMTEQVRLQTIRYLQVGKKNSWQHLSAGAVMTKASRSSGNAFVSEAGGLRSKSRASQIGHSVASGSPPLRCFFERSCVVRAQ